MINKFSGEYRFLSNFYSCSIEVDGIVYPSVEHAYQASKTLDENERHIIRNCVTASEAKRVGRRVTLRKDWENVKLIVMHRLLKQKFTIDNLRDMLLDTEDDKLIEGNNWGDTFWGVCNGVGKNHLGRLLMLVRDEIR